MLHMFLLYHDPNEEPSPEILEGHFAFAREVRQRNAYVTSEALAGVETAKTLRVRGGKPLSTDGPFAETKEVLGGYYVLDCRDFDEALEYAAKIPTADTGSVEIRPVLNVPGWEYSLPGERFS